MAGISPNDNIIAIRSAAIHPYISIMEYHRKKIRKITDDAQEGKTEKYMQVSQEKRDLRDCGFLVRTKRSRTMARENVLYNFSTIC